MDRGEHRGPEKTIRKRRKFYKPVPKKEMPKRYKTVCFFEEKRKIIRKIEQLEKRITAQKEDEKVAGDQTLEELEQELAKWEKDLIYVKFYPKTEKYISLYPKSNFEQCAERRDQMRQKAEQIAQRIQDRKKPKAPKPEEEEATTAEEAPEEENQSDSDSEEKGSETKTMDENSESAESEEDDFFL